MTARCEWCEWDYAYGMAHTHNQCKSAYERGAAAEREACVALIGSLTGGLPTGFAATDDVKPTREALVRAADLIRSRGEGGGDPTAFVCVECGKSCTGWGAQAYPRGWTCSQECTKANFRKAQEGDNGR